MSIPKDIQTLDNFAFQGNKGDYFPENTFYSLPVLTQRGNRVYQASFMYDDSKDEKNTIKRPFAWSLLPLDDSPEYLFSWCEAHDFLSTREFPFHRRISAFLPAGSLTEIEIRDYNLELAGLFGELIDFAFLGELSLEQQQILSRFKDLFLLLCYQGLYEFYNAIAPDFFQWLGLILVPEHVESSILHLDSEESMELGIIKALSSLSGQFQEKIAEDSQKELLFNQLHQELQEYKTGSLDKMTQSMERDVILVIDHIEKSILAYKDDSPTPAGYKNLLQLFQGIQEDLTDLLYRQGVDPYEVESDIVQVPRQKVLTTEETNDPTLDKVVAEKLSQGWEKAGRVVRPEYVRVYLYQGEDSSQPSKELDVDDE